MKIAVVILNWNGKKLLEQFLSSVIKHSKEANVYVADNASTDDSIEFIKEFYPSVKIVENAVNGGYAKGYNDALQQIDADVFCLLNNDVEVSNNWLSPIIKCFKENSKTAIIQPKILEVYLIIYSFPLQMYNTEKDQRIDSSVTIVTILFSK